MRLLFPILILLLLGAGPGNPSSNAQTAGDALESLSASSRRTGLVLSEIMYHPAVGTNGLELEYVELFNSQPFPEEIGGYRLSGSIDYLFPSGTLLPGGAFLVVAKNPANIQTHYGISNVVGPYTNNLPNDSGLVRLRNRADAIQLEVNYGSKTPWPRAADGTGHSLVLARPSYGEGDPRAWAASDVMGGSPGRLESFSPEPLRPILINEFLAHSAGPELDFIELHNHGNLPVDISGAWLSDEPETNKFRIPDGTVLPPRGFVSFDQNQLGFALSSGGESIYLVNSDRTRVIDAVGFGAQALGVASGRFPDGAPTFHRLQTSSPGTPNAPRWIPGIVVNEIMYHPISRDSDDEYVELFNRGASVVSLAGWELSGGIRFTFPGNATLPAGGYLVVARNVTNLLAKYPQLNTGNTVGNFNGALGNGGDRVALTSPEEIVSTNLAGVISTNLNHVVVNEVTYGTGGRWGQWADAGGSSLELIDPRSDNRLADNWADSDETAKAPWSAVEQTGRLAHGDGLANALHLFLLGAGECLVDDVEVIGPAGANLLANSSFESGLPPWVLQGNHEASWLQNDGGWNNSRCLHVRTDDDGDPGANKIRVPLSANLAVNSNATLRARVRWLRGHPEILLRTAGNYLEAAGRMVVPVNLGTPGAPNSRALANAGPAIFEVRHEPVLPAPLEPVRVTARLEDPDGLGSATVRYRIDPDTNTVMSVPLLDDGTSGDEVAGDGLFSATLPGRPAGEMVAFYVQASDNAPQPVSRSFPTDAPVRECLIRFGESQPAGTFGSYRIWITQATFNHWTTRLKMSNQALDTTFVYGNHRVIYNVGALYAGSPYHAPRYTSPTGVACDYKLVFPEDDRFLGSDEATIVWPGLTGGDPVDLTAQREVTSYGIAGALGLPFNYQRYVHFFVNGVHRSFIMQDTQKPDGDMVRQWFDSDGSLFKVQVWTEVDPPATSATTRIPATLGDFISDGVKKTSRYRWNWTPRAIGGTANRFTELFALVDAVNSPTNTYTGSVEAVVDIEQWMRTFAVEHIVGNWDSYGYSNGQNMYAYKPGRGRWQMMIWDLDVSLGNASDQPTDNLFKLTNPYFPTLIGDPAVVGRMYQHPQFARAYWRAVQDAVNGPLLSTTANVLLDARAGAFAVNGVSVTSPDPIKSFLSARRAYCLGRLATVAANFGVSTPSVLTTSNNLVLLSGTAPVNVRDIVINGALFPVTWTSVTSWTARVVVSTGTNELIVQGLDRLGNALSNSRRTNTLIYTEPAVEPAGTVVINEIMYHPAVPDAAYVELFNTSTTVSFDLGNWRLNGVDYTFPPGSILTNGQFLVLAQDRAIFAATYGTGVPVFAEFDGNLQTNGETLTLFRPGLTPDMELVVDKVRFEATPPWPGSANGLGASLQLIDAAQDNARVSNWAAGLAWQTNIVTAPIPATPGSVNAFAATLPAYDPLWLNEVQPNNLTGLADVAGHRGPWLELYNAGAQPLSLAGYYLTDHYSNLTAWPFPTGLSLAAGEFKIIWADGAPAETSATEWHTSFRLPSLAGSVALVRLADSRPQIVDYLNYAGVAADQSYGAVPDGQPFIRHLLPNPTPGQSNIGATPTPVVFINEWMASNVNPGGYPEPVSGNYEDWFELYNPGPDAVNLAGCTLTDDLAAPFKSVIPAGYNVPARGYLLVWADGQPSRNRTNSPQLHVGFQLSRNGEAIGLFAPDGRPIDAITFGAQTNNVSEGRSSDGSTSRVFMNTPTPGAANLQRGVTNSLAFTGIQRLLNGDVVLSCSTIPGRTYRLEYKADLKAPAWTALGADYQASATSLSIVDPTAIAGQRFYQIRELPDQ